MPDRSILTLRQDHARLRALLRAFLKTLADGHRPLGPRDLARMRTLLLRIRLEIAPDAFALFVGAPDGSAAAAAVGGAARSGTRPGDFPGSDHLQDLVDALMAVEVLGEDCMAPLRLQALLFAEWQLARMDRVERETRGRADAAEPVQAARLAPCSRQASTQASGHSRPPQEAGVRGAPRGRVVRSAAMSAKPRLAPALAAAG